MHQVMIWCPFSGDLVPTGLAVTSLEKLDQAEYLLIDCLECGEDHLWEPSQATLAGPVLVRPRNGRGEHALIRPSLRRAANGSACLRPPHPLRFSSRE